MKLIPQYAQSLQKKSEVKLRDMITKLYENIPPPKITIYIHSEEAMQMFNDALKASIKNFI